MVDKIEFASDSDKYSLKLMIEDRKYSKKQLSMGQLRHALTKAAQEWLDEQRLELGRDYVYIGVDFGSETALFEHVDQARMLVAAPRSTAKFYTTSYIFTVVRILDPELFTMLKLEHG